MLGWLFSLSWTSWIILCLLEWKLGYVRTFLFWCRLAYERYSAPQIDVPNQPMRTVSADPSSTPLNPRSAGEGKIQCYEKATNKPLGCVPATTPEQVKEIVEAARQAQEDWSTTTFAQRRKVLFSILNYIVEHQRLICETSAIEAGKTLMDGTLGEVITSCEKISWTTQHGEDALQDEVRSVGLITAHKKAVLRYVPFGVIGAIVSWNYPFHNIVGPMMSALFAGNAFVGKVSELASWYSTTYYEKLIQDALVKNGHSPHLVRFLAGYADAGSALTASVDKLTFIGSPEVGAIVMKQASATLTPVVLELGGKDPAVVCEDADLDVVMPILMRGTFQNCGQNCAGLERVVAQESIYDKIVQRAQTEIAKLTQGPTPTGAEGENTCFDLGAMAMGENECLRIQKLVDDSVAAGARLLCGGNYNKTTTTTTTAKSSFYPPTLLVDVTPDMPVAQKEAFAPIFVVMKFITDDQAVEVVNKCPYGLGSNVFSKNAARASSILKRLRAGMGNVNDYAINYLCQSLPFGGVGLSGFDRFAGLEGLRGNCMLRAETYDRFPGVSTQIPPILQYPMTSNAFLFGETLVKTLYGSVLSFIPSAIKLASIKPAANNTTGESKKEA